MSSKVSKAFVVRVLSSTRTAAAYRSGRRNLDWVIQRVVEYATALNEALDDEECGEDEASCAEEIFVQTFNPVLRIDPSEFADNVLGESQKICDMVDRVSGEEDGDSVVPVEVDASVQGDAVDDVTDGAEVDAQEEGSGADVSAEVTSQDLERQFRDSLVSDLPIHGLAKSAYATEKLITVQDALDYVSAGKSLTDISGIGEDFANDTLAAIEALRVSILG